MVKARICIPESSSELQEKFIGYIMHGGKRSIANQIFQDVLAGLRTKGCKDPVKTFEQAIENVMPIMEVRPKRIGGGVFQIPVEVKHSRQRALAFRWILDIARKGKGRPMYKKLTDVLMEAAENTGAAVKKKEDVHRMAEANKAFAHLARY
ncbi:30S ribosomal protein S7 [Candidatus Peregrinibacteria bacterium CG1_02_41_10]|nr:MAG: 30S ribosomal protein S7 [Candidatus Peregrinibacteria bacterium CG1_02_41_10]